MAMSAEHRSKICSPSIAMVLSPYEWKILEWDEKTQINKQIHKCGEVSIAAEGLPKFGFARASLLRCGLDFVVSSERLPHLVTLYDKQDVLRTLLNRYP